MFRDLFEIFITLIFVLIFLTMKFILQYFLLCVYEKAYQNRHFYDHGLVKLYEFLEFCDAKSQAFSPLIFFLLLV